MQLPEYLTPAPKKPEYFTFNRCKGQDQLKTRRNEAKNNEYVKE